MRGADADDGNFFHLSLFSQLGTIHFSIYAIDPPVKHSAVEEVVVEEELRMWEKGERGDRRCIKKTR